MTKKLQNYLPVLIFSFGLLVLATIFLDVLKTSNGDAVLTGVTATFGGTPYQASGFFDHTIQFSFLNLIAFGLPALIGLVAVIAVINEKKTSMKKLLFGVLLTFAFVISTVLIFQIPSNTTHITTILGAEISGNFGNLDLAIGGILAYVFSIIGAVLSLVYSVLQFEK